LRIEFFVQAGNSINQRKHEKWDFQASVKQKTDCFEILIMEKKAACDLQKADCSEENKTHLAEMLGCCVHCFVLIVFTVFKLSQIMLTQEQVRRIAKLARLNLNDSEVLKFSTQLSGILDYVKMLEEVDTEGVEPTYQVTGLTNVMGEDCVLEDAAAPSGDDMLACSAHDQELSQIRVKSVM
jgi:aspartyl-tRNA(Asn)/glutamyl-tRNA(Gln) amidotransferase subunit C